MKGVISAAVLLAVLAGSAQADKIVYSAGLAGQGVWFSENARPSDFEGGVKGAASLSPHISAVGSALFGFQHSYTSGKAGLRFTVSDAENRDFSIGVGIQRQFSSEPALRPEGWRPDVSLGWKPWPQSPRVLLTALGDVGLEDGEPSVAAGITYRFTEEYKEAE